MSQCRYELTNFEWSIIEPLLPDNPRGRGSMIVKC